MGLGVAIAVGGVPDAGDFGDTLLNWLSIDTAHVKIPSDSWRAGP